MKIIIYLIFQYGPMLKLCPVVSTILDFWLTQKHTHFVKDHQRNIPVMISVKCLKKKRKKKKFSLWWLPSRIFFFNWNSIENPIKKKLISIEKPFVFNLNYICKTIVTKFKNHWLLLETPLNFHLFGKIC